MYGVTQNPVTKEYFIVMQYASDCDLFSYLNQHINNMTWEMKLACLRDIASQVRNLHDKGLVHCDLHGGNIVFKNFQPFGLSKSKSSESKPTVQGGLPFIAPEVFSTRKFTPESDIYAFGIIMYTMASGEPPFRNRASDSSLVCDILNGLRPAMPYSAPKEYKEIAESCCNGDPRTTPHQLKW